MNRAGACALILLGLTAPASAQHLSLSQILAAPKATQPSSEIRFDLIRELSPDSLAYWRASQPVPGIFHLDPANKSKTEWNGFFHTLPAPPTSLTLEVMATGMPFDATHATGAGIAVADVDQPKTGGIAFRSYQVNSDGVFRVMHYVPGKGFLTDTVVHFSGLAHDAKNVLYLHQKSLDAVQVNLNGHDVATLSPMKLTSKVGLFFCSDGPGTITLGPLGVNRPPPPPTPLAGNENVSVQSDESVQVHTDVP